MRSAALSPFSVWSCLHGVSVFVATVPNPFVSVWLVSSVRKSQRCWCGAGHVYTFRLSMVEIYNEALRDLLAVAPAAGAEGAPKDLGKRGGKGLDVKLRPDGSLEVVGLQEVRDSSALAPAASANAYSSRTGCHEHSSNCFSRFQ